MSEKKTPTELAIGVALIVGAPVSSLTAASLLAPVIAQVHADGFAASGLFFFLILVTWSAGVFGGVMLIMPDSTEPDRLIRIAEQERRALSHLRSAEDEARKLRELLENKTP